MTSYYVVNVRTDRVIDCFGTPHSAHNFIEHAVSQRHMRAADYQVTDLRGHPVDMHGKRIRIDKPEE